jgi:hypothetical protein
MGLTNTCNGCNRSAMQVGRGFDQLDLHFKWPQTNKKKEETYFLANPVWGLLRHT